MICPGIRAATAASLLLVPLAAQADWRPLAPATMPTPRVGHAMAYDLINDRVVLFGGLDASGRVNDTWLYDGVTWTQALPTNSPPARAGHPLAFDLGRGRVVLFGGIGTATFADTWEWDGQNWTQMFPATNPPQRRSQPMVYSPVRGTVVMWGGYDGAADINDMWEWNGIDWQQIVTATSPTPRRASEMAFDPNTGGIVLFSGYQMGNDTWMFDNSNWTQLLPAHRPSQRYDHSMATDLLRSRVVMFGGTTVSDTWEWDGTDWLQRAPLTQPPARYDTYLAYDRIRDRTLMFGLDTATADMWEYSTASPAVYGNFGTGCNGSNNQPPRLSTADRPWIGDAFELTLDQLPASTGLALLYTGFSNTTWNSVPLPLPLAGLGMPGCTLLIAPQVPAAIFPSGGAGSWTLPLPDLASLIGIRFFNQAVVFDAGANAAGATVSNGGDGTVGAR